MSPILRRVAATCAAVLLLAPAACGSDDEPATSEAPATTTTEPGATTAPDIEPPATEPPATEPPATEPPATEPPATEPPVTEPPATEPPVADVRVNVYWAYTVGGDQVPSPERVAAGARFVAGDAPTRRALEALFAGTNAVESDIGMLSTIPAGTRVLGISTEGTTATVDLSGEFEAFGGSLEERFRIAQVVYTVTQFDAFDRVMFHIDGEPRDILMQHGLDVRDGVTRGDFSSIRPLILIESPAPGEAVGNPLVVRGESTTFEGTIDYALTTGGGDGIIVTEGFTMGGGFGEYAPFELVLDLADFPGTYLPGPGSIIMWETSPRDGTQQHIVEIPIVLPTL